MTPNEFRKIRHRLGLSTRALANLLGVSDGRTVRRWEAGTRFVPGPITRLMRLLATGKIKPADLA